MSQSAASTTPKDTVAGFFSGLERSLHPLYLSKSSSALPHVNRIKQSSGIPSAKTAQWKTAMSVEKLAKMAVMWV